MFRCADLELYVNEVDPFKKNFVLLNKADLLTEEQRYACDSAYTDDDLEFIYI